MASVNRYDINYILTQLVANLLQFSFFELAQIGRNIDAPKQFTRFNFHRR